MVHDKREGGVPAPASLPPGVEVLASVLDDLPQVMFSLKGIDGVYLHVNQAFADRTSARTVAGVVGRRAADLFAPALAVSYEAQDRALIADGRPVRRRLELITRPDGGLGWYVTNKSLVREADGSPSAVVAVSLDARTPAEREGMVGLEAALEAARTRFASPLTAADLAAAAGMSTPLLERRMRRALGIPPTQLIVRVRVDEALHRIAHSDRTLADIAAACGFSDHAAMTRQIRRVLGVPPSALRRARPCRPQSGNS